MYVKLWKRVIDFLLSIVALIVLSPVFLVLIVFGAIKMKGNPFFTQLRPGKNGKIFKLLKFRSMTCEKDAEGNLLPDDIRLTKYGKMLRDTSLDELPEIINILMGDMSIVGPRPLLPEYLPYYTEEEMHRHDVLPGLTGLAQVNGRSFLTWEEILSYDVEYVRNISIYLDIKILLLTIKKVFIRENIADVSSVEKGEDGQLYVKVGDRKLRLHQPLNIERGELNA